MSRLILDRETLTLSESKLIKNIIEYNKDTIKELKSSIKTKSNTNAHIIIEDPMLLLINAYQLYAKDECSVCFKPLSHNSLYLSNNSKRMFNIDYNNSLNKDSWITICLECQHLLNIKYTRFDIIRYYRTL